MPIHWEPDRHRAANTETRSCAATAQIAGSRYRAVYR